MNYIKVLLCVATCMATSGQLRGQSPSTLFKEAGDAFNSRNYHAAIEKIELLLEKAPGAASSIFNLGISHLNLGDLLSACEVFEQANKAGIKPDKKWVQFYCNQTYKLNIVKQHFYKNMKLLPEHGLRPLYGRKDSLRGAMRPERSCFDVLFYDLEVKINPNRRLISGKNTIHFTVLEPSSLIQIDLFDNYSIGAILHEGVPLSYYREYDAIFIHFNQPLEPGEKHNITIVYSGSPRIAPDPPWDGGFVWKRDKKRSHWAGVACQKLGASSWWPNKDHLSDEPDSMRITLEVPQRYMAISNGTLRGISEPVNRYRKYEWFVHYPINNYNVTFYLGNYAYISDTLFIDGKPLLMKYYVLPYNLEKAKAHFWQAQEVVSYFSEAFGEYPFMKDGFGLVESPYAGMEHQSAIAYGNDFDSKSGSHAYRNGQYDYIIVHEAAHEWWGNSLSAGDMADAWIHEGFATFAELMFIESRFGYEEYLYELAAKQRQIVNIWPLVQNYNVNENSFAGNDIYNKGAIILNVLRCALHDDSLFFSVFRSFAIAYKHSIVGTQDFIDFFNSHTNKDFTPLFDIFLFSTRVPTLVYSFEPKGDDMLLTCRWENVGSGFTMPFAIKADNGRVMRLVASETAEAHLLEETEWFSFFNIFTGAEGAPHNSFTWYNTRWERK